MRAFLLFVAMAVSAPAAMSQPEHRYVQAVEFPYYLYPRQLWERELVWLKARGIRTVAFSIPWNWHQEQPGPADLTGRTSPRRDLVGFIRILRRLGLRAWIRPLPPVSGWLNAGYPTWAGSDRASERQWLKQLASVLETQVENHGGPIAFVEGVPGMLDAPAPPSPVVAVPATEVASFARSRLALASGHGSLLWKDVEDSLFPAGWEAAGGPLLREGAVSLKGDERPTVAALRRDAALLRHWAPLIPHLRPQKGRTVRPVYGPFPAGVTAVQLFSSQPERASAVSIVNQSDKPFSDDLRVFYPAAGRYIHVPAVGLGSGEALWLPIDLPLSGGLCGECSEFANTDSIIYATAELQAVEFENGILAMEFAAPNKGEVVLQLSRQPSGPLLAAGRLTEFDWDAKTLRARLPIPAGTGPEHRVRIGLAIEPPEISAFFGSPRRLLIGQKNVISTSYSSEKLAARSRLRLDPDFTAKPTAKSPAEIDYEIDVPTDELHGDWTDLAIEADGVLLGRAHLQLFRSASLRLREAIRLQYGPKTELQVEPPVAAIDPKAGRNLEVTIRNNAPEIRNFTLEASGKGLSFFPPKTDISIGAVMERTVSLRVFADVPHPGVFPARLRLSGAAQVEMPVRLISVPRGQTVAYSMDLDGDGYPEWVLENQNARAVFSAQDGGRWMEFVWKNTGLNFLPSDGALVGSGPTQVQIVDGGLEFAAKDWKRTIRLTGPEARLTVEQSAPLPVETLHAFKKNEIRLEVVRQSPLRAVYTLQKEQTTARK